MFFKIITSLYIPAAFPVGKLAIFRAVVTGKPAPTVKWVRNNGEIDEEKFKILFDSSSGEYQLQVCYV